PRALATRRARFLIGTTSWTRATSARRFDSTRRRYVKNPSRSQIRTLWVKQKALSFPRAFRYLRGSGGPLRPASSQNHPAHRGRAAWRWWARARSAGVIGGATSDPTGN